MNSITALTGDVTASTGHTQASRYPKYYIPYVTFDQWFEDTQPSRNVKIYDGPQGDYIYDLLKRTPVMDDRNCGSTSGLSPRNPVHHIGSAHATNSVYISKRTVHLLLFLHQLGVRP